MNVREGVSAGMSPIGIPSSNFDFETFVRDLGHDSEFLDTV